MKKLVLNTKQNELGVLGKATTVSKDWLEHQTVPFPKTAVFHTFYPVTGGAMVVDINTVVEKDEPTQKQLDQMLGLNGYEFNPADTSIKSILGISE